MTDRENVRSAAADGLPVAPSLDIVLEAAQVPPQYSMVDRRVLQMCGLAVLLGIAAAFVAVVLVNVINFVTNLAFFGRFSLADASPADNHLGRMVVVVPVIGSLFVGFMARYGSKAIRGHGIPEAMEQVLTNQSRIPARMTFLKPVSAAISIGTGGPFGAEGPIIATGGALGSLHRANHPRRPRPSARRCWPPAPRPAWRRRSAARYRRCCWPSNCCCLSFGRVRSFPWPWPALRRPACAYHPGRLRAGVRDARLATSRRARHWHFISCSARLIGLGGRRRHARRVWDRRRVRAVADPLDVVAGHRRARRRSRRLLRAGTLGVGYYNIERFDFRQAGRSRRVILLCALKFVSWSISLGSGTSGGTLAPLFTIGGGLGAVFGAAACNWFPEFAASMCGSRRWSAWPRCSRGHRGRCWPRPCSPLKRRCNRSDCCRCWVDARRPIWCRTC